MVSIDQNEILKIYTDGAARGNPGPAASAFVLVQGSAVLFSDVKLIGNTTNNSAEYNAILNALTYVKKFYNGKIKLYSDSQLAIKQITGEWKINYPHLANLKKEILTLSKFFRKVEYSHIPRTDPFIQICDKLCNEKLDRNDFT
ncbi:MAG: ribonuclease HI family protein [Promethearchaeota archaeon]|nr:MAG: ribonuclease HI family protein [Candidatus Lokiarchaeota archaeon]